MAVRGVDHHDVDTGSDERLDAFFGVARGPDCGPDAQAAELVLARERMLGRFEDVLDGDQTLELEAIIDHEHALEAMLMHQRLRILQIGAFGDRHQPIALGHDIGDGLIQIGLEAEIPIGHDADDLSAIDDRQPRDLVQCCEREHLAHRHRWRNRDRVLDHAALEALDLRDLGGLRSGRHVLVHDSQTAFLRNRDREPPFSDGIHRCREQGNIQRDAAGEAGLQADVAGNDGGLGGKQQDVVESQRLLHDTHGAFLLCAKADYTRVA